MTVRPFDPDRCDDCGAELLDDEVLLCGDCLLGPPGRPMDDVPVRGELL